MAAGIILFAHGSRDPLWRAPIEAVAARIRTDEPSARVACAYLELMEPDIATAAGTLIDGGASSVAVVPMFLGMGRHAREDLPALVAALRSAHPGVTFDIKPAVGEDERLIGLLAQIAVS